MPTILRHEGYRFFFFSLDRGEPPHIHVSKGDGYAKFWLDGPVLVRTRGIRSHELTRIRRLIEQHAALFEEKWHEHFAG